jgi:uncharacterized protein YwqG
MVKKYRIHVRKASAPIMKPVTKLGGQPVWIDEPQWPLSRSLGVPMRFLGQFTLVADLFSPCEAQMAYLFITEAQTHAEGTWRADGSENAVILQPGRWEGPVTSFSHGPTLYERVLLPDGTSTREDEHEYSVTFEPGEDPEVLDENAFHERDEWDRYIDYVDENKVGGVPAFLQYPEYPGPESWRLITQLNAFVVPCGLPFGNRGIGYAFLSEGGDIAKFLWQS